jgi:hypothetical protein
MIMPDSRIRLRHEGPSLLNIPTEAFRGAGASLYGPRGPQRAAPDYGDRRPKGAPPESLSEHIDDAIAKTVALNSPATVESVKFMVAFWKDAHDAPHPHPISHHIIIKTPPAGVAEGVQGSGHHKYGSGLLTLQGSDA